jgi:hypothetical protein
VAEDLCVAALYSAGHGLAHEGKCLVPIQSAQLDNVAVEFESALGEVSFTKTD